MCDNTFDGIMTGIYDAYYSGLKEYETDVLENTVSERELMSEYVNVITDEIKAKKVQAAIRNKISEETLGRMYTVFNSSYERRGSIIYKYIRLGFKVGYKINNMLTDERVLRVNDICRKVGRENNKLLGFVRFKELNNGVLYSQISPEHNQLEFIAPHFTERLHSENWIIYDDNRDIACVHEKNKGWYITELEKDFVEMLVNEYSVTEEYEELWKAFFSSIAIKERNNPRCQRQMMPKKYWKNMLEMQDKL